MSLSSPWSEFKRCNVGYASSTSELVHLRAVLPWGSEPLSPFDPSTGRFNVQFKREFLFTSVGRLPKDQESTAIFSFSRLLSNFQQLFLCEFPGYSAIHHTFRCKRPWTACSSKHLVPGCTWIYFLRCNTRRSPRLIAINHLPVYHCHSSLLCAFWVYYSNKRRVMTRRSFEDDVWWYFCSKMRRLFEGGGYSRAAFNRINSSFWGDLYPLNHAIKC